MFPRTLAALLCVLAFQGARATLTEDVELWDRVLAAVPAGATTVELGDQIVPLDLARSWRDRLAALAAGQRPPNNLAAQSGINLWPGGNVYYSFNANVTANHQAAFLSAARDWEIVANVHFILRTSQANYILVNDAGATPGGNATVGMAGGQQSFNIGNSSWARATLLHELGHTLGLIHEHQRSDRDSFVSINLGNVSAANQSNFTKMMVSNNQTTYDFLSVMHYARDTFSANTFDTIVPQAAYTSFVNLMGRENNPVLSRKDRTGVANLYGPSASGQSLVVTNVNDSGPGSLRAAVQYANDLAEDTPGMHPTVTFQIPAPVPGDANVYSGGTFIIRLNSSLLPGANITVNGDSQGNNNAAGPEIRLTRAAADAVDSGFAGVQMIYANSELRGFAIDGFKGEGVEIKGTGATGNVVAGCYIGATPAGTAAAPNTDVGVRLWNGAHDNLIGGTAAADRNLISGNAREGVVISGSGTDGNQVAGNWIGLSVNGTALPNTLTGVVIFSSADGNIIGGDTPGAGNVISGNGIQGITIQGPAIANEIMGNYIGLNPAGTAAVPNASSGVVINGGATNTVIGGVTAEARNVISGHPQQGIGISSAGTTGTLVLGNYIGLNAAGLVAIANGNGGIAVFGSAANTIIGGSASGRNYISGNSGAGLIIQANGNAIKGNTIGLGVTGSAVANTMQGITITGTNNTVGGTGVGDANRISGNSDSGVVVYNPTSTGNAIAGNSIYGNGALGIDLYVGSSSPYTSGPTPNDTGDADAGGNSLQNCPSLTGAVLSLGTTVSGSLNSTASSTFRIEFFASPVGSSIGDARIFVGATSVTTNASGDANISAALGAAVKPGSYITATATDAAGNTSELAPRVTVTVVDNDADGLPDAWETANGFSVGTNESALDPDGDRLNNLGEFYAGTGPRNGTSYLKVTAVEKVGSDFRLTIPTVSGRTYQLEYTDNLNDSAAWRLMADQILGPGGDLMLTDFGAFARSGRYYRVKLAQ